MAVFEFSNTFRTEKSETMWACMKIAKASATSPNSSNAADRPRSISARLRADAPDQRHGALHQRDEQREHESEMANLYEHAAALLRLFPAGQGNSGKNPGFGNLDSDLSFDLVPKMAPRTRYRHGRDNFCRRSPECIWHDRGFHPSAELVNIW